MMNPRDKKWMPGVSFLLGAALAAFTALRAQSQPPAQAANARDLVREAIGILSTRPLGRDRVDWKALEQELTASIAADAPPASAHSAIEHAVAALHDSHAKFQKPSGVAPPATPTPQTAPTDKPKEASVPQPARPAIPEFAQATVLRDGIVHLMIPMCPSKGPEHLERYARLLRNLIEEHAAAAPGWVIDLRLNGGGNLWPMLLGIEPLIGAGPVMTSIVDGKVEATYRVDNAAAWIDWGRGPEPQLRWAGEAPPEKPVRSKKIAVVLGSWTMSSGEALAISLRGSSRSFGEPTAGLTTVTNFYPLSDGSVLNLPVSQMGDRKGAAVNGRIVPDVTVSSDGWPSASDAAVEKAREWVVVEQH